MLRRSVFLAVVVGLLWTASAASAGGRHIAVTLAEDDACYVNYETSWGSPKPGQDTIRYVYTDLVSGGTKTFSFATGPSAVGTSAIGVLVGDQEQSLHAWRLNAALLDGSSNVLAKGTSKRVDIFCTINP